MFYFKSTIRYILGIGAMACVIGPLIEILDLHLLGFLVWPFVIFSMLVDFPTMLLFPIASVCSYFITKRFWSVFKTEYYFWFSRVGLYVLLGLISVIADHFKH